MKLIKRETFHLNPREQQGVPLIRDVETITATTETACYPGSPSGTRTAQTDVRCQSDRTKLAAILILVHMLKASKRAVVRKE